MLRLADIFFLCFHSILTLFNLFGWIHPAARKWNLATLLLTGVSWFGLGIFYGWGYCPLTEWHFRILEKLGHQDLPLSYISYMLSRLFGLSVLQDMVDAVTLISFFAALAVSLFLNIRGLLHRRAEDGKNTRPEMKCNDAS
ncbi:MAG: DUF2784 family protein [Bacteroidales bacterium]|nr:DUF2784 family protein [Bacteroidales bacterium]